MLIKVIDNLKKISMAKQLVKSYEEPQEKTINIISENTIIKGDIRSNSDIRIEGEHIGNIEANGRLVIGPTGKIEGDINCSNIEVSGYIRGKLIVRELLTMKASARIYGDIAAGKLSVEPGSLFTGTCSMGGNQEKDGKSIPKEQKKV